MDLSKIQLAKKFHSTNEMELFASDSKTKCDILISKGDYKAAALLVKDLLPFQQPAYLNLLSSLQCTSNEQLYSLSQNRQIAIPAPQKSAYKCDHINHNNKQELLVKMSDELVEPVQEQNFDPSQSVIEITPIVPDLNQLKSDFRVLVNYSLEKQQIPETILEEFQLISITEHPSLVQFFNLLPPKLQELHFTAFVSYFTLLDFDCLKLGSELTQKELIQKISSQINQNNYKNFSRYFKVFPDLELTVKVFEDLQELFEEKKDPKRTIAFVKETQSYPAQFQEFKFDSKLKITKFEQLFGQINDKYEIQAMQAFKMVICQEYKDITELATISKSLTQKFATTTQKFTVIQKFNKFNVISFNCEQIKIRMQQIDSQNIALLLSDYSQLDLNGVEVSGEEIVYEPKCNIEYKQFTFTPEYQCDFVIQFQCGSQQQSYAVIYEKPKVIAEPLYYDGDFYQKFKVYLNHHPIEYKIININTIDHTILNDEIIMKAALETQLILKYQSPRLEVDASHTVFKSIPEQWIKLTVERLELESLKIIFETSEENLLIQGKQVNFDFHPLVKFRGQPYSKINGLPGSALQITSKLSNGEEITETYDQSKLKQLISQEKIAYFVPLGLVQINLNLTIMYNEQQFSAQHSKRITGQKPIQFRCFFDLTPKQCTVHIKNLINEPLRETAVIQIQQPDPQLRSSFQVIPDNNGQVHIDLPPNTESVVVQLRNQSVMCRISTLPAFPSLNLSNRQLFISSLRNVLTQNQVTLYQDNYCIYSGNFEALPLEQLKSDFNYQLLAEVNHQIRNNSIELREDVNEQFTVIHYGLQKVLEQAPKKLFQVNKESVHSNFIFEQLAQVQATQLSQNQQSYEFQAKVTHKYPEYTGALAIQAPDLAVKPIQVKQHVPEGCFGGAGSRNYRECQAMNDGYCEDTVRQQRVSIIQQFEKGNLKNKKSIFWFNNGETKQE
ncbi:Conserved_hypothetical protein [Hexamita inflata]|uniref:Uncharacterized protein n=1 Tax=Hexamita inflata TaxID=28002 RepID=A0AA86UWA2_9EUKA|nr:Conserved hypothetical protein [Hexamita inflata]